MSSLVEACADPRLRNFLEFTISQLEFLKMETLDLMSEEGRRAYEVTRGTCSTRNTPLPGVSMPSLPLIQFPLTHLPADDITDVLLQRKIP